MAINKNPYNLPTEKIDLTSKGLVYPEDHILRQGYLEVIYPSARQDDILTNINYINKGVAEDKYLESVLLTEVNLDDMIPGDKDGFMIAARILGFGKSYTTRTLSESTSEVVTFDLTSLKQREIDWDAFTPGNPKFVGVNEFEYILDRPTPVSIHYKLLNGHDQNILVEEETGERKVKPDYSANLSLLLKHSIVQVDGSRDTKKIRDFVDRLLQSDARDIKRAILKVSPAYIWRADGVKQNKEIVEDLYVPYTVDFFWPRY